ncbi:MAG: LysR family transcriptional regulator [Phyllobacteriaceae bacterium]|nr:LysR family transcriptional regulator [Phyllobacteriaceae bacterium]
MSNLSLRQFRSLVAIADTGKIANAANRLRLTGPAVTIQLRQMEDEFGLALFDRTADGMRPTVAGIAAIDAARVVLDRLRQLDDEMKSIAAGGKGALTLGVVSTAKYFAPRMIATFQKRQPGIVVDLVVGNRAEIIDSLRRNTVDIALMGRPPRDVPVRATIFGDHPLVIVAPPDHPLAGRRDIAKEVMAREHFLLRESGSGTRISLEFFFSTVPGMADNPGTEMGSNETIKQAVMAGLGVAFLSAHTIEQELQLRRLVILDVAGMPIRRQWFTVSRADRTPSPAMQAFAEFLAREGAGHLPVIPNTYPLESVDAAAL